MDEVETAAADTTSGNSPLALPHPFPGLLRTTPLPCPPPLASDAAVPCAVNRTDAFKRHRAGKVVPIGIAHPLRQNQGSDGSLSNRLKFSSEKGDLKTNRESERGLESSPSFKRPKLADMSGAEKPGERTRTEDLTFGIAGFDLAGTNLSDLEDKNQFNCTPPYSVGEAGVHDGIFLPPGKRWHLFVTHSTSESHSTESELLKPMSEKQLCVTASCRFMNKRQEYNNAAIKDAMKSSCVILVAISKHYLESSRYISLQLCYYSYIMDMLLYL